MPIHVGIDRLLEFLTELEQALKQRADCYDITKCATTIEDVPAFVSLLKRSDLNPRLVPTELFHGAIEQICNNNKPVHAVATIDQLYIAFEKAHNIIYLLRQNGALEQPDLFVQKLTQLLYGTMEGTARSNTIRMITNICTRGGRNELRKAFKNSQVHRGKSTTT